jgi:hypothetical protein
MRGPDVVDFELRLFAVAQEHVAAPSIGPVDALLDGQQRAVAVVREHFENEPGYTTEDVEATRSHDVDARNDEKSSKLK